MGQISQLELLADTNTVWVGSLTESKQMVRQYGFKLSDGDVIPFTATGLADLATKEAINYFETLFAADIDARLWKSLRVGQMLNLRITSGASQTRGSRRRRSRRRLSGTC